MSFVPGPFDAPKGSFRVPVDPPTPDPDADPVVQICVNKSWLPYLAGACKQFLLPFTWHKSDPADRQHVLDQVGNLFAILAEAPGGCGVLLPQSGCQSVDATASPLNWISVSPDVLTTWVPQSGWQSGFDGTHGMELGVSIPLERTTIVSFDVTGDSSDLVDSTWHVKFFLQGALVQDNTFANPIGRPHHFTGSTPVEADSVTVSATRNAVFGSAVAIFSNIQLCYVGKIPIVEPRDQAWEVTLDFTVTNPIGVYSVSYASQGGNVASWVAGVGYGGSGVYFERIDLNIHGDGTTTYVEWVKPQFIVHNDGSGFYDVSLFGNPFAHYVAPTDIVCFPDLLDASGPFPAIGSGIRSPQGNLNANNWPGNPYSTFLQKVTIHGRGATPSAIT